MPVIVLYLNYEKCVTSQLLMSCCKKYPEILLQNVKLINPKPVWLDGTPIAVLMSTREIYKGAHAVTLVKKYIATLESTGGQSSHSSQSSQSSQPSETSSPVPVGMTSKATHASDLPDLFDTDATNSMYTDGKKPSMSLDEYKTLRETKRTPKTKSVLSPDGVNMNTM